MNSSVLEPAPAPAASGGLPDSVSANDVLMIFFLFWLGCAVPFVS